MGCISRWEIDESTVGEHNLKPVTCDQIMADLRGRIVFLERLLLLAQKESNCAADNVPDKDLKPVRFTGF